MPTWIRNILYGTMLLCCVVIGARVYLEFNQPTTALPVAAESAATPASLPEFTLNDIWGEPRNIREWSGKPILLNFWATWCAPCRREMPLLQALHSETAISGLQVVGLAIDRQPDVLSYITESGITYPILSGEADAMAVADLFGLDGLGLPFSVVAASDGQILTLHIGEVVRDQLAEMVAVTKAFEAGELDIAEAREQLNKLQQ